MVISDDGSVNWRRMPRFMPPLLVVAGSRDEFEAFRERWGLGPDECEPVRAFHDLAGIIIPRDVILAAAHERLPDWEPIKKVLGCPFYRVGFAPPLFAPEHEEPESLPPEYFL